jgi:tellurite resistance protein TerC
MTSLEVTAPAWAATLALIAALFTLDLFMSGRRSGAVEFREALAWSVFYVLVALAFGVVFGLIAGSDYGAEYFAGYIVEKSLSVDNLFVFLVIMTTFAVPPASQRRVLTFGILAALILRAAFITIGAALLAAFSFTFLLFGLLLIFTAIQLFRHRDQDPTVEDNVVVAFARRRLPFTDSFVGDRLVVREGRRRLFTPLFLVFLAIATVDVIFALDSIPAIFGITEEAYIVFAANAFALLGLRALFFLVSGLLDRLVYLSTGLSLILLFIGVKLVFHYLHKQDDSIPEVSIELSLVVIVTILAAATLASVIKARRDPQARAHAGSLRGHRQADTVPEP